MNKQQLKRIQVGTYQNQYLIYCRKSTDDSENQRNSLGHQRKENLQYMENHNLFLANLTIDGFCSGGIISESHSGFKEDDTLVFTDDDSIQYKISRPKFNQMIRFLNEGYFKGIVCMSWDRLSRNKADNAIITKLIRKGVDIQFVTAKYENSSAGALHMDIDGMFAQHHSRVTREKVKSAMHKMRNEGIVVYMSPLGYLDTGKKYQEAIHAGEVHKPHDPERAPLIQEIYRLYATGDWSMPDLAKWANEQGLTNIPKRRNRTKREMLAEDPVIIEKKSKPISVNNIHYILKSKFYLGLMQNADGQWIESKSHEPMVSQELFDKAQKVKKKKHVSRRYKRQLGHALRGFVRCSGCNRVFTPYMKKGIQYFSSRCVDGCENTRKSFNLAFIEAEIGKYIPDLFLTKQELEELDSKADMGIALIESKMKRNQEQSLRKRKTVNEELSYLRENRLSLLKSGAYQPEEYLAEEEKLVGKLTSVNNAEVITQESLKETIKEAMKLSELLENLTVYYEHGNSQEKEEIVRCIFSELYLDEKVLVYKLKNEFKTLKKDFILSCPPARNRT